MEQYNAIIETLTDVEEAIELLKEREVDWDNDELDTAIECIEEAKESMILVRRERFEEEW